MNEKKLWRAAIYLRLSKEDQNSQSESCSITNQRELILDFLKNKDDIEVASEHCDDGVSGVSFDRPAFTSMLEDVRDGIVDCIIVKDLSRFGRNHIEAGKYIENIFPVLGVRFIAVNDNIDTKNAKTSVDNILIPFKNLINDAYCRDISIKIRSQFEVKRKKGLFVGAFAAYGYCKDAQNKNQLVIDEQAAGYVREIYRLRMSGVSAEKIAQRFNLLGILSPMEYKRFLGQNFETGFKTNPQAKWSATAILRILKNPLYIGTLVQGKEGTPNHKIRKKLARSQDEWSSVPNSHSPIVEMETFLQAQKAMRMDTRTSPEEKTVFLFSGLLYCGHCGHNMIRKTIPAGKKNYVYYVCAGNKADKSCTAKGIRDVALTETIFCAVKNRIDEVINSLQRTNPKEMWIIVDDTHEPIVSKEVFDTAQSLIKEPNIFNNACKKAAIHRKVKCGWCGRVLIFGTRKGHNYTCDNRRFTDKFSCDKATISVAALQEVVLLSIQKQAQQAADIEQVLLAKRQNMKTAMKEKAEEIQRCETGIESFTKRHRNLFEAMVKGEVTKEYRKQESLVLTQQREELESHLKRLTTEKAVIQSENDINDPFICGFKEYQHIESLTNEIVERLIDSIHVYDSNSIEIVFKFREEQEHLFKLIEPT